MTYEEAYKHALALIEPHMRLAGRKASVSDRRVADLRQGIDYLDAAIRLVPSSWAAWWLRGKAEQAAGDHEAAHESLSRAYAINSENVDVARELVAECLETGRAAEGIHIAEALCQREPRNAGLLANLAVAYLIGCRLEEAGRAADSALQLDRSDPITVSLRRRIQDVRSGRWPQPTRLSDLSRKV